MNVFPEPVAIWISDRGRSSARDCSRLRIASACLPHSPRSSSGGMAFSRARKVGRSGFSAICRSHSVSVSGRWKVNTRRLRASGSYPLVNRVSAPVDS